MNAERLLAHYERISEAPDAVERLRRFIRELAVRGALVSENLSDGPSSALLKEVSAEIERHRNAGAYCEPRSSVVIKRSDLPFTPPARWGWAKLTEIASVSYGFAFPSDRFNAERRGMPLIRIRDISSADTEAYFDGPYDPSYLVKAGDYLVGMDGDFNLHRWRGRDGLLNQRVLRLNDWRCGIDPEFVRLPLQFILDHLHGETSQTTVKHLSAKQVNGIEIPLPPLAEQRRIVAKVNELMALCDRLEAARMGREAARDRLTVSSLARLNSPDPETFRDDARFVLNALPALSVRVDQVKQIRQTILNLAVRGKLVPQDPSDEPAAELLKRVHQEKESLVAAGKLKRAHLEENRRIQGTEAAIPHGWMPASLQSVFLSITDGDHLPPPKADSGVPFLVIGNVRTQRIEFAGSRFVPRDYFDSLDDSRRPRSGDLLYTLVGSYGIPVIVRDDREFCVQRHIGIMRPSQHMSVDFLSYALSSSYAFDQATACATGIAQKTVSLSGLRRMSILVPPLAEQRRIVTKVDELLALCDRLEASLTDCDASRGRLLEALLAEALGEAA